MERIAHQRAKTSVDNRHSPGPEALYPDSVTWLSQGCLTDSPEAGKMLKKQLAFENAKKTCKEALRGLVNT